MGVSVNAYLVAGVRLDPRDVETSPYPMDGVGWDEEL